MQGCILHKTDDMSITDSLLLFMMGISTVLVFGYFVRKAVVKVAGKTATENGIDTDSYLNLIKKMGETIDQYERTCTIQGQTIEDYKKTFRKIIQQRKQEGKTIQTISESCFLNSHLD